MSKTFPHKIEMNGEDTDPLIQQGYVKKDFSYSPGIAYVYIILLLIPTAALLLYIYSLRFSGTTITVSLSELSQLLLLALFGLGFLLLSAVHELLHALAAIIFGKAKRKDIRFGIIWKALTPYTHCTLPMTPAQYRAVLFLPNIILGVLPYILSLVIGSTLMYWYASLMLLGGLGDLFIFFHTIRLPADALIKDHPHKIGFVAYLKESK